jgi:hypothetical protein
VLPRRPSNLAVLHHRPEAVKRESCLPVISAIISQCKPNKLMSFTGTVEGGVVKLPPEASWADGTKVRVEPLELQAKRHQFASADLIGSVDGDGIPATNERVRKVMGGCRR